MSAYLCVRHGDAGHFLDRAKEWLLEREAENNLILGIAAQLQVSPLPNAYFVTVEHDHEIVGCGFRTPPYKLGLTRMPAGAARALARDAVDVFGELPAVLGPDAVAREVASEAATVLGKSAEPGMRQRIYELRKVIPPARMPPGRLRLGQRGDESTIIEWLDKFTVETDHGPGDVRSYTQAHVANKTVFIWDDDGPKTTALWAGLTPNGVRIGFVYTPPEFRGKGYASACVAGASQRALDSGFDFCCLYTDLGNPTSNSIYQKIGYEPICDVVDYNII